MEYYGSQNEKQISLRVMIFKILYNWRKIFLLAIIFAIICGCYKYVLEKRTMTNSNTAYEQNLKVYKDEFLRYEASKNSLESEISDIKTHIERQSKYNNSSLIMKINPFNEYVALLAFYIDTNYQINPNLTYQSKDKTNSIARAYYDTLNNGDIFAYLVNKLSYKTEIEYLKEIISIWPDYDTDMLYVQIINKDEKSCEEIMNLIENKILLAKDKIVMSVGEHELIDIQKSIQSIIDISLDTRQRTNIQNLNDYDLGLNEKKLALQQLTIPIKPIQYNISYKNILRYTVIGAILGIFIEIFITILLLMMNNKIISGKDFRNLYNIKVIGNIQKDYSKHLFGFVDRFFKKLEGMSSAMKDREEAIGVVCANLKAILQVENLEEGCILFTGSICEEKIEEICKKIDAMFSDNNTYKFQFASNINYSSKAISQLTNCDAIILVEEAETSTYNEIEKELEWIDDLNKKVIGVVIV